jgi:hypothetical protein
MCVRIYFSSCAILKLKPLSLKFKQPSPSENPTNHSSHSSLAKHSDGFALWKSLKSNLFFTLTDGRGQVISRLGISCWKKY